MNDHVENLFDSYGWDKGSSVIFQADRPNSSILHSPPCRLESGTNEQN